MSAAQTVRDIIEASRYLVLATADASGRPARPSHCRAARRPRFSQTGFGARRLLGGAGSTDALAGISDGGNFWWTVTSDTTNQVGSVSCLNL
jgi:hypothetical protein